MSDASAEFAGRLAGEAARLLATSLSEFVPPEAQAHLLAAQRELLLALAVILEHNQARFRGVGDDDDASAAPRRRGARRRSAPRRPQRVELE
ncbi:MAG: hypothetical protein ACYDAC_10895 [Candidatus Dormibacteria bacterium]